MFLTVGKQLKYEKGNIGLKHGIKLELEVLMRSHDFLYIETEIICMKA